MRSITASHFRCSSIQECLFIPVAVTRHAEHHREDSWQLGTLENPVAGLNKNNWFHNWENTSEILNTMNQIEQTSLMILLFVQRTNLMHLCNSHSVRVHSQIPNPCHEKIGERTLNYTTLTFTTLTLTRTCSVILWCLTFQVCICIEYKSTYKTTMMETEDSNRKIFCCDICIIYPYNYSGMNSRSAEDKGVILYVRNYLFSL